MFLYAKFKSSHFNGINQAELDPLKQLKQQLIEDLNKTGISKITYNPDILDKIVKLLSTINLSDISSYKRLKMNFYHQLQI